VFVFATKVTKSTKNAKKPRRREARLRHGAPFVLRFTVSPCRSVSSVISVHVSDHIRIKYRPALRRIWNADSTTTTTADRRTQGDMTCSRLASPMATATSSRPGPSA